MNKLLKEAVMGSAVLLCVVAPVLAKESAPKQFAEKGVTLHELSFLKGTWRATIGGETTEEIWGAVLGDSIVGHCQSVQNSKTTLFELLSILKEGDRIVMRIKHFKGGFVPWAEKDESGDLNLISLKENEATFQNNATKTVSINYKRKGKQLTANVCVSEDGQKHLYPFTYSLIDP